MTKLVPVKKLTVPLLLFLLPLIIFSVEGCHKKRDANGQFFFKQTHNKMYQDFSTDTFAKVFKEELKAHKSKLKYADIIAGHYKNTDYKPEMVMNHFFNNDLLLAADYYQKADEHGLSPNLFKGDELRTLINTFNDKQHIRNLQDAYKAIADIEINAANSLIIYSNALQYGVINPKAIFHRYFMATKRPDETSMQQVFHINNMQAYLDSIQPKSPQYKALQKALADRYIAPGLSGEESKRILLVNLERLRWRNKPYENKYVVVNIPDFRLDVIDSGKSVLNMKVCTGQGRNMDNANTLENYNDTCKIDKPNEHETPLLNSLIYYVEVNPVWNIPASIAGKEILVNAAKDPDYLTDRGINVYKDGKLVDNPEDIDWTKVTKENSPYEFKQDPGEDNSLGKIKFLFKNNSNVYLHDTPVKSAFYKKMRAVSHGCVRLGDPRAFALNLFGPGPRFDEITKEMDEGGKPNDLNLPKKVPVYITYVTCWQDENQELQFRNDVYGLDIVLYDHLQRLMHPELQNPKTAALAINFTN